MLQEALLVFACLNNTGCNETFNNYKSYNSAYVESVEQIGLKHVNRLDPALRYYALPVAALVGGGTASFTVVTNLNFTVNTKGAALVFTLPLN